MADRLARYCITATAAVLVGFLVLVGMSGCAARHKCPAGQHWERGAPLFQPQMIGKSVMLVPTFPFGRCEARQIVDRLSMAVVQWGTV